ncbi:hypothetical protein AOQ84DRAFT_354276 [Glonium stellatum]|uniref:Uncharacterized protein n=1 Tax=Glonium stellatum TaxID=574774 RepID=A0A8E2F1H5_9PEZI|nr:hypothetical protein AOQ84DRAFT_354276 [Glonium stellatum]
MTTSLNARRKSGTQRARATSPYNPARSREHTKQFSNLPTQPPIQPLAHLPSNPAPTKQTSRPTKDHTTAKATTSTTHPTQTALNHH